MQTKRIISQLLTAATKYTAFTMSYTKLYHTQHGELGGKLGKEYGTEQGHWHKCSQAHNILLKHEKHHLRYTLLMDDISLYIPGDVLLGKDVQETLV